MYFLDFLFVVNIIRSECKFFEFVLFFMSFFRLNMDKKECKGFGVFNLLLLIVLCVGFICREE